MDKFWIQHNFVILFISVYEGFICMRLYASHACLVPSEARKGNGLLWDWN